jgi:hypothetical protein
VFRSINGRLEKIEKKRENRGTLENEKETDTVRLIKKRKNVTILIFFSSIGESTTIKDR